MLIITLSPKAEREREKGREKERGRKYKSPDYHTENKKNMRGWW
jgi:hypothetical protein